MLIGAIDTLSVDDYVLFNGRNFRLNFKIHNVMCMSMDIYPPESSLIKKYVCRSPDSALMAPISMCDTSVDLS